MSLSTVISSRSCVQLLASLLKLPGYASVTEVMKKDLHWLGFPQRISYKLCTLTYKCLHGMATEY